MTVAMLSVPLDAATERRLADLARDRGQSESDLARDLIEASLDDLEDIAMAVERLENRQRALTRSEARAALGLDD